MLVVVEADEDHRWVTSHLLMQLDCWIVHVCAFWHDSNVADSARLTS
jgi:hypothetical protein